MQVKKSYIIKYGCEIKLLFNTFDGKWFMQVALGYEFIEVGENEALEMIEHTISNL